MQTSIDLDSTSEYGIEDKRLISRVQAADPNNGRCLVENCSANRGVIYRHVVPQNVWTNVKLLDSLEWHWGLRSNTLNLETHRNIFPAGATIHRMFDAGQYIFVPAEDIVQRYHGALIGPRAVRNSFPVIEDRDKFEYRLVPLKDMEEIFLMHQNDTALPLTPNAFTTHLYPFTTLPTLVSHIHPKFVIVSAGLQLRSMLVGQYTDLTQTFPILKTVFEIYLAWARPGDDTRKSDTTYWPPYNPDGGDHHHEGNDADDHKGRDYSDAFTRKERAYGMRPRQDSPTPNFGSSYNLSRGSLIEHTRKTGKAGWDEDVLTQWSSSCQPCPADPLVPGKAGRSNFVRYHRM